MIDTIFFRICEGLAAAFMHALLCHRCLDGSEGRDESVDLCSATIYCYRIHLNSLPKLPHYHITQLGTLWARLVNAV